MARRSTPSAFNTPGCVPGSMSAIPQHTAIAMGYSSPSTPRTVKLNQSAKSTGGVKVPGLHGKR